MSFSKRLFEAIHDGVEADEPPPLTATGPDDAAGSYQILAVESLASSLGVDLPRFAFDRLGVRYECLSIRGANELADALESFKAREVA
jgi:hypothetical protein